MKCRDRLRWQCTARSAITAKLSMKVSIGYKVIVITYVLQPPLATMRSCIIPQSPVPSQSLVLSYNYIISHIQYMVCVETHQTGGDTLSTVRTGLCGALALMTLCGK